MSSTSGRSETPDDPVARIPAYPGRAVYAFGGKATRKCLLGNHAPVLPRTDFYIKSGASAPLTRCFMQIKRSIAILIAIALLVISIGCNSSDPVTPGTNPPLNQTSGWFTDVTVRFDTTAGEIWISTPRNFATPLSEATVTVDEIRQTSLVDMNGSCRFVMPGSTDSIIIIDFLDNNGFRQMNELFITSPDDFLEPGIAPAGKYPNRMHISWSHLWVVNSGDDELTSYDPDTLLPDGSIVTLPLFSNPWDCAFSGPSEGVATTLFNGVFVFDASDNTTTQVDTTGFRDFASPNGVAMCGGNAWVVNPNPVSYFPTEFGPGWISKIRTSGPAAVIDEIDSPWLNPQHVISRDDCIYVSCSGTVDFVPPDYFAVALDDGGVMEYNTITGEMRTWNLGLTAPGPMVISPGGRFLYAGSGVAANIMRIDLATGAILNGGGNPIVISDTEGSYIPFMEINEEGLIATASFNDDLVRFVDSGTGDVDPFPFFEPIELNPDNDPMIYYGPQDAVFTGRNGEYGLLILSTIDSGFHWLPF